jgi:hypothetical protein
LPGIGWQQRQTHQPALASLTIVAFGFECFRFTRQLVKLFGVYEGVAFLARERTGSQIARAAAAVAN